MDEGAPKFTAEEVKKQVADAVAVTAAKLARDSDITPEQASLRIYRLKQVLGGARRKRSYLPVENTLLRDWLHANNVSVRKFAVMAGTNFHHVSWWASGKVLPSLHYAFIIERLTRGGVPASYWLGTVRGREMWNVIQARQKKYAARLEKTK